MRVGRAASRDAQWLQNTLNRESQAYGVAVEAADEGGLVAKWRP
jgi:hypothetical protein